MQIGASKKGSRYIWLKNHSLLKEFYDLYKVLGLMGEKVKIEH